MTGSNKRQYYCKIIYNIISHFFIRLFVLIIIVTTIMIKKAMITMSAGTTIFPNSWIGY